MDKLKLIVFTAPYVVEREPEVFNELFYNGLEILHLRKPDYNLRSYVELLSNISQEFHNRIVIHNHFELTNDFDLKGIHLSSSLREGYKLSLNKSGSHIHSDKIVSTSCHSFEELRTNKDSYEYLFLSPIFDSISKGNYFSQFSVQYLLKAKTDGIIDRKVIALGGINLDRINFVIDYGFGGIGVLGFLWEHYNYNDIWGITNKFLSLKNKIEI